MGLTGAKKEGMLTNMVIAAFLMIALGYPGELITDETSVMGMRGLWGFLSTLPFVYIVYTLWNELGIAAAEKEGKTAVLYRNIRALLLATWGFYPIVYMAPFFGWEGASTQVAIQVGYSIADVLAKAGYGVMIYAIAKAKSDDEGYAVA